jgi:hypothetical protein
MKKILFLGNSHIGALRKADQLHSLSSRFSCSSSFIGIPGRGGFYRLSLDGEYLVTLKAYKRFMDIDEHAYSDQSPNLIRLSYFDRIVFVAGLCRLDSRLYYPPSSSHVPLLSKSVIESIVLQDSVEDSRLQHELPPLFWRIMALGRPDVVFLGAPLVSADARIFTDLACDSRDNVRKNSECIRTVCSQTLNDNGRPLMLLPSPELLDDLGLCTKASYFVDSLNWAGDAKKAFKQERDMSHANATYGKMILEQTVYPSLI